MISCVKAAARSSKMKTENGPLDLAARVDSQRLLRVQESFQHQRYSSTQAGRKVLGRNPTSQGGEQNLI